MCEVASLKNFENSLTTVKVMTKNKVAPFYMGHGVEVNVQLSVYPTQHVHSCNSLGHFSENHDPGGKSC